MPAAIVLHPDGDLSEIDLGTEASTLALMREHLDARLVDCVALTNRLDMWIDDEGFDTRPANPVATALAFHHGLQWQPYHGPALICGVDEQGSSINLTDDQIRGLLTQLADAAHT